MTVAMMILATAAAYAAGIATALVLTARRAKLGQLIPPDWLPRDVKVEPPPKPSAPIARSPFAPKPKPKPKPVEPPRKRLLHWPVAADKPQSAPDAVTLTDYGPPDSPRLPSVSFLPHNDL